MKAYPGRMAAVSFAVLFATGQILSGTDAVAATYIVTMDAMQFSPSTLVARPGDRIVWVNKDLVPHTATSADGTAFDSRELAPGASWAHVVRAEGHFPYVCSLHPSMQATLEVRSR